MKTSKDQRPKRCWEFFHCSANEQKGCLMAETQDWRCWLVNIPCCKIHKDTPLPLRVKSVVCKTCEYYKTYGSKK